jgi:type VI secretion system protein VasJ
MNLRSPDVWISHLLETIPLEKQASTLCDDNPDWDYIDSEIVNLGALAHGKLDIPEIQRRGLRLLATESKDFRLLAHLLRIFQHAGNTVLAVRLLVIYVEHFWTVASPQNAIQKQRLALQVLKRFESGMALFTEGKDAVQSDQLLAGLATLRQHWQENGSPILGQATENLIAQYQRAFNNVEISPSLPEHSEPDTAHASQGQVAVETNKNTHSSALMPPITIDNRDDKAWRDSLLKVANLLCEAQPSLPLGYRIRRHAVWHTITAAPQADSGGRTQLAGVPVDMVADYQARLKGADLPLWQQVEKSLLLAPYWLDGHYLSAQIALLLGYEEVALVIREETVRFLERLPMLHSLCFNDHMPFIADATRMWLEAPSATEQRGGSHIHEESQTAHQLFEEQGIVPALLYLESLSVGEPRDQFYRQFLSVQLQEKAGMAQLAQQHYRLLLRAGKQIGLSDWEPALLTQLEKKIRD